MSIYPTEDKREIKLGKVTNNLIRLLVATNDLSGQIYNALGSLYVEEEIDKIYEECFADSFSEILQKLQNHIGRSIYESITMKDHYTEKDITV